MAQAGDSFSIPPKANLAQRLVLTVACYQAQMVKALRPYGIGASEYPVLIYLRKREEEQAETRGSSQRDIAQRQHRDPALINRAAKSLAAKGLITMTVDPESRNRHLLKLTDEGRDLADHVNALVQSWEDKAEGELNEQEQRQLIELLSRLQIS